MALYFPRSRNYSFISEKLNALVKALSQRYKIAFANPYKLTVI